MGNKLLTINRKRIPRAMPFPLQEPLPKSTVRPYFLGFLLVGFSPILLLVVNNQSNNEIPPKFLSDGEDRNIHSNSKDDDNNSLR
jgi:hypothetical protein